MKLTLPIPTSINATYKIGKGHYYKSQKANDWTEEARYIIYKSKPKMLSRPCYVSVEWFLKRDRDIDNSLKLLLDALQKWKVIENDSLIHHLNVKKYIDRENPRCEIEVQEMIEAI